MLQSHSCRGVPCRRLSLLDVFGHVVEVSQNGGAEPARCDGFCEVDILLDSLAHLAGLRVGQWLLTTQHEVLPCAARQIRYDLRNQVNDAAAGICLCSFQKGRIPVGMRNSTLNADRMFHKVNVLPLQSQDFLGAQGMQGVQCEVISVHRLFDVGDVLYQVAAYQEAGGRWRD